MVNDSTWSVYLVRMPDRRLYCGVTTDVERRFGQHQNGTGAKALRGKAPLELAWTTEIGDHSLALQVEYRIKKLSKIKKEAIIQQAQNKMQLFEHISLAT